MANGYCEEVQHEKDELIVLVDNVIGLRSDNHMLYLSSLAYRIQAEKL